MNDSPSIRVYDGVSNGLLESHAHRRPVTSWEATELHAKSRAHVNNKERQRSGAVWGVLNVVFFAWCIISCPCIVYCWPRLPAQSVQQLILYWQPLLPIAFMIWLWGYNVHQFENMGVPYELCFSSKERRYLVPADDIFKVATVVTAFVTAAAAAFCLLCLEGMFAAALCLPAFTYLALLLFVVAPVDYLNTQSRLFFAVTVKRVLLPIQEVTWSDFLLADVLTSLSKSFNDMAKAACGLAVGGPLLGAKQHPTAWQCSPLGAHVLLALCLPYIIRFVQCILVNRTTGSTAQIFNAIKYASAFPALVLSAIEHEYHVRGEAFPYRSWWLGAMFVNTIYSTYWDVEMDWDMPWLVSPGAVRLGPLRLPAVRMDATYALPWYGWAVVSNAVFRLAWAHRLLGNLENYTVVALCIAMLEAYRRYQWVYIRVETEIRKIRAKGLHEQYMDAE